MKKYFVGRCIYCGSSEPPLTDEHTVPFGFNGDSILENASCRKCASVTSAFETVVLRDTLFAVRAAVGAKTRRKKEREKKRPMYILKDGKEVLIEAQWQEHWKVIPLPVFEPPAFLSGRKYDGGLEAHRMDFGWVGESPEEIAKMHNADDVLFKIKNPKKVAYALAKLVAKIAYGTAVAKFGLSGIKEAFVVPGILGQKDDLGMWVGCDGERIMPSNKYNLWCTRLEIRQGMILGRVKLFTKADGTEYIVVIGNVNEGLQGFLHGVGYTES